MINFIDLFRPHAVQWWATGIGPRALGKFIKHNILYFPVHLIQLKHMHGQFFCSFQLLCFIFVIILQNYVVYLLSVWPLRMKCAIFTSCIGPKVAKDFRRRNAGLTDRLCINGPWNWKIFQIRLQLFKLNRYSLQKVARKKKKDLKFLTNDIEVNYIFPIFFLSFFFVILLYVLYFWSHFFCGLQMCWVTFIFWLLNNK